MQYRESAVAMLRWSCAVAALLCTAAQAHEPVARCFLLDDSTVRCRGVTNDGDEMPGARMDVIGHDGRTLLQGTLSAQSTLSFARPAQAFYVLFEIGPGLQTIVEQDEIRAQTTRQRKAPWLRP
ncbi:MULTISPECIES: hypothetical protein [Comamonas]|uniref:Uncharacterized protein n=1 Tax=Comamonas terrigena TaxID=32013 RepID=A0A2A7US90_COMTR|nr:MULTISPECIES: hypothetical protein [Comamonas]MBD9533261.1 hypothetical protein [Comamonas sp. CMM01]PEH88229.1 hypothetical protein CRM82_06100 [Comamonas terrigena]BBL23179.1 hypothetical protein CT3_06340 [Comamonas terrigena NBRC 13299]SUY87414.1 Uncharacterised protein [Comamonas terrigena]